MNTIAKNAYRKGDTVQYRREDKVRYGEITELFETESGTVLAKILDGNKWFVVDLRDIIRNYGNI